MNCSTGSVYPAFIPYDENTAKAVLGLLVQRPDLIDQCDALGLNSSHFEGQWQTLWEEICQARAEGRPRDLILLSDHLQTTRPEEGHSLMLALTDCVCVPAVPGLLPEYCEHLITAQRRRDIRARASRFLDATNDPYADWEDVLARLSEMNEKAEEYGPTLGYRDGLPAVEDAATLCANPPPLPEELIEGVLHRGAKLVLGGSSKSFKTWTLTDLAISVASGTEFWEFPCRQGRVLYVNLEIDKSFYTGRVRAICAARGITLQPGQLSMHNLRGFAADAARLVPQIIRRARRHGYALIIIDPIYKMLGGRDENASRDMADLMNLLEKMAVETGAAVAFGSHFAKGNASAKESIDRISGSGVFARDPDTILTMTRHEQDDAFTIEMTLRNHPPQPPFVVKHRHPLMVVTNLDPAKLKQVGKRTACFTGNDILSQLTEPMATCEWEAVCKENEGISERTFYRLRRALEKEGRIFRSAINNKWHRK